MKKSICAIFILSIFMSFIKGNELNKLMINKLSEKKDTIDLSCTYYWYYISLEFKTEKENNNKIIKISFPKKNMKSGTYDTYAKCCWRCLQSGNLIVNGPFRSMEEAQNSLLFYNVAVQQSDSMIDSTGTIFYWYKVNCQISKKTHAFITTTDYKVCKGNSLDFILDLKESLQNGDILEGPWDDYQFYENNRPKPFNMKPHD